MLVVQRGTLCKMGLECGQIFMETDLGYLATLLKIESKKKKH
jgi:hypothetical protein